MQRGKKNSGSNAPDIAAIASAVDALQGAISNNATPEQFCKELARIFHVQPTEVALLQLEYGCLKFLSPAELKIAGSIPLSSSSSIVAHTASAKKAELYNNFPKVKHASIFETVRLTSAESMLLTNPPIQKLMSAPVLDGAGSVLGVLQICRKGHDLFSAGGDFTSEHLQQLERAARAVSEATFMQKRAKATAK